MALFTQTGDNNILIISAQGLAAGASVTGDLNLANSGYENLRATLETYVGGSPDGNVVLEVYRSNNGGTNDDSFPFHKQTIVASTSRNERTPVGKFVNEDYLAFKVTNNDTTDVVSISLYCSLGTFTDA